MIRISLMCLTIASVTGSASAQSFDATNWSGPYIGVHGGYGFDVDKRVTDTGTTPNNFVALGAGIRPTTLGPNRSGALGGAQAGYNMQSGSIVYGLEADFSLLDSKGSETYRSPTAVMTFPAGRRTYVETQLDWMGSVRGRVGYSVGSGLFYVTGGYAYGQIKGRAEFNGDTDAITNYAGGHKYVAQGWTAGGGLEFRPFTGGMLGRASFRAETLYYDLGKSRIEAAQTNTPPGLYTLGFHTRGINGRIGVNYAF